MTDDRNISSDAGSQNRRAYARVKVNAQVEMEAEGSDTPIRGATSD